MKEALKVVSIIVIIAAFAGIIFGVTRLFASECRTGMHYDKTEKKCIITCNEGEKYYPSIDKCLQCPPGQHYISGGCQEECNANEKLCGDKCYLPKQFECIDGQLCAPNNVCDKQGGVKVCCASNEQCDSKTGCGKCQKPLCGDICCHGEEVCYNNKWCCDPDKQCKDEKGEPMCCEKKCCNGVCCGSGLECSPDGDCKISCGKDWCDPDTQLCQEYQTPDGKEQKYCHNINCEWDTLRYDPQPIGKIDVCKYKGKLYNVRNPSDATGGELRRTATTTPKGNNTPCSKDDCYARLVENGITNISWSGKSCTGSFDCQNKLPELGDCPFPDGYKASCCLDTNNKFTGQVCNDNMVCIDGSCVQGWKCQQGKLNHGKVCVQTDKPDEAEYTSKDQCEAACKCDPGWRINSTLGQDCNDFACKLNGKERPDMYTWENGGCQRVKPKVNPQNYCSWPFPACKYDCKQFAKDAGDGYKLCCYWNDPFSGCTGFAGDVSPPAGKSWKDGGGNSYNQLDPLTGKDITYYMALTGPGKSSVEMGKPNSSCGSCIPQT